MSSEEKSAIAFGVVKLVCARLEPDVTYVIMTITVDTIKCNTKTFLKQ